MEEVSIQLTGASKVNPVGHSSFLTGEIEGENSLQEPTKITPEENTFSAGANFKYAFPANSITVLRVSLIQN
jgi:alpha-L-arabinofuranosidase